MSNISVTNLGKVPCFPIWHAVRTELSWSHYRNHLRVEGEQAHHWYPREKLRLVMRHCPCQA